MPVTLEQIAQAIEKFAVATRVISEKLPAALTVMDRLATALTVMEKFAASPSKPPATHRAPEHTQRVMRKPSSPDERLAYKLGEFSELVGLSVDALRDVIKSGQLPAKKFGRLILIKAADAHAWLDSLPSWSVDAEPETTGGKDDE